MAYLPPIPPHPPELEKLLIDYMLKGDLSQALEVAIQSQNSQEVLRILENVKDYHACMTSSGMKVADFAALQ